MKAEIIVEGAGEHKVEVQEVDGRYRVLLHNAQTNTSEELTVDFDASTGVANLLIDNRSYLVELSEERGRYHADIQTHTMEARLYTLEDRLRELLDKPMGSRQDSIEAKMPGKVIEVFVAVGDEVAEGDKVAVLEAMKMENTIRAPRTGVIASVEVSVGDNVQTGQTIITFEAQA